MFVTFRGNILGLLTWQWKALLLFAISSTTVVVLERVAPTAIRALELPITPVLVVGGAISIFVGFRTNSAYDRWWEGRKLWGQLINSSRHFATQVLCYLPSELHGTLVRRHIAYVHALRVLLREQKLVDDPEFLAQLPREEAERVMAESNPTHALLHAQMQVLASENRAGRLDSYQLQSLDLTIRTLLDVQGGCERIKKTPFPRSYGFIADRLTHAYGVLLPLGLVTGLNNDWVAIPLTILVCLSFTLISEVGRILEDPFTMFWPALPLSALATTIEINLRQRLGDTDLPAARQPDARGILM
jgi:putative membrane protein